jgi:hypothetical protein
MGELMGNAPDGKDGSKEGRKMMNDWTEAYEELQLSLIQEDCCYHLPLDHPFGEQLRPPKLEHWLKAPGVGHG